MSNELAATTTEEIIGMAQVEEKSQANEKQKVKEKSKPNSDLSEYFYTNSRMS